MTQIDKPQKLRYTKGWKYQVVDTIRFELKNDFIIIPEDGFSNMYYSITPERSEGRPVILTVYKGCCWDGPTWFPDFKWMMRPSLIHDVLHWLIAKEVIPFHQNDLIDKELADWIEEENGWPLLMKGRGLYTKRATNLIDQKIGVEKKIYEV